MPESLPTTDIHEVHRRVVRSGRKRARTGVLDNGLTRYLFCLAVSVGIFVGLAEIPIYPETGRVGWQFRSPGESFSLELMTPREEVVPDPMASAFEASAMIDRRQPPEAKERTAAIDSMEALPASAPEDSSNENRTSRAAPLEVFQLSGRKPSISGGLGSLYMHVDYPLVARERGIEGRVILTFVVREDGTSREVEVIQSAHPALDSAAVRAVRRTRFVPGRHNGESVSVRMRLPIRFQLVSGSRK